MPSKPIHVKAGMVSGAAAVAICNHVENNPSISVADLVGGIAGGYLGGRIPDLIDPSKIGGPNHRSYGHGIAQNSALAMWIFNNIQEFRKMCFEKATEFEIKSKELTDDVKSFFLTLVASFLRFVAGLAIGVIAGIISHLTLDSFTKKGLPIFYNKF